MTVYQTRAGRPRWVLHMQAVFWRVLMGLGMFFHRLAPPRPPKPAFWRQIPSTIAGKPGMITLYFYVPRDYETQRKLWTNRPELDGVEVSGGAGPDESPEEGLMGNRNSRRISATFTELGQSLRRRSMSARRWGGYPLIVNFHGGGFTLGQPGDDARWCNTVVDECHAVVVSVDYRLAPECAFPTAVEDGVDAVLYLHNHAEELGIDTEKIALSGFSSGGNMAFTVPLRLHDEISGFQRDDLPPNNPEAVSATQHEVHDAGNASTSDPPTADGTVRMLDPESPPSSPPRQQKRTTIESVAESHTNLPNIKLRCIISWYPSLDYTRTREQRRATCARKDQELPALFTDLFDESYLHPPTINLDSPYLSPGVAPTALLKAALPEEIIMHTCEWDMLLDEGQAFRDRLQSEEIGKKVWYKMVENVPHGWDKAPNPWKPTPGVREHYLRACKEMRRVFGVEKGVRPPIERDTTKGFITAAPRGSIAVVR